MLFVLSKFKRSLWKMIGPYVVKQEQASGLLPPTANQVWQGLPTAISALPSPTGTSDSHVNLLAIMKIYENQELFNMFRGL